MCTNSKMLNRATCIPITYQSLFSTKDFSLSNSMATASGVHMTKRGSVWSSSFMFSSGGTLLVDGKQWLLSPSCKQCECVFGFAEAGVIRGQPECCREHVVKCILGLSLKDFLGELWLVYRHTHTHTHLAWRPTQASIHQVMASKLGFGPIVVKP